MANTVFTPDALERSVARDLLDRENGDGEFLEVWDAAIDGSSVTTSRGEISTTPETVIYYR